MEAILYISSVISIILYCITFKWSGWGKKNCVFCLIFWVSMIGAVCINWGTESFASSLEFAIWVISDVILDGFLIAVLTNIMFFFIKHLNE